MESIPDFKEKLIKIIACYCNLLKEKDNFMMNLSNDLFTDTKKEYYLIDKDWFNNFKKLIKFKEIEKKIKYLKEDIIKEHIENYLSDFNDSNLKLLNNNKINDKDIILKELLENKNFPFEIINEEVKNNLTFLYKDEFLKMNGAYTNNRLLCEFESSFNNKNIILLFSINKDYLYQLFIIIDYLKNGQFLKIIENLTFEKIFNYFKMEINNITENGEINIINLEKDFKIDLVTKKIKNNFGKISNIDDTVNKVAEIQKGDMDDR